MRCTKNEPSSNVPHGKDGAFRAVIYTRVSSKEQVENNSLPTQERSCREFCVSRGWSVSRVFEEQGESAKTADRTELQKMLAYCTSKKNLIDFVVVFNLSRLDRQMADHVMIKGVLMASGITLQSVTETIDDTPVGKLTENVVVSFHQFDNDIKSVRSKIGMKDAVERGRFVWKAPLGFLNGREPAPHPSLVHDPASAPLVRRAFEMVASGVSRGDARRRVHALGLRGQGGGDLSVQSFNYLLRNHVYRAWVASKKWGGSGFRGDFEPIVDDTLFWIVQRRLTPASPTRVEYQRDNPEFPLRGLVRCGQCGGVLTGSATVKTKTGQRFPYYHCTRRGCKGVRIPRYALEGEFERLMTDLTPKPEFSQLFREIVLDVWRSKRESITTLRADLRRRVDDLMAKKDRIFDHFDTGKITGETYRRQTDRADADIGQAQLELAGVQGEEFDVGAVLDYAVAVLRGCGRTWKTFLPEQRRRFFRIVFPEGVTWTGEGFGTTVTGSVFGWLRDLPEGKVKVVPPAGFEPAIFTLKAGYRRFPAITHNRPKSLNHAGLGRCWPLPPPEAIRHNSARFGTILGLRAGVGAGVNVTLRLPLAPVEFVRQFLAIP